MTRLGFRLLVGLLLAIALGGALLAAPSPAELGVRDSVECASLLREPRAMGSVRLIGCELDVGAEPLLLFGDDGEEINVSPELLPPSARALRDRARQASRGPARGPARDRYRARHVDDLTMTVDLEGEVSTLRYGDEVLPRARVEPSRKEPFVRAFGLSLLLFSLPMVWLLMRLQRRWSQRSEGLGSGAAKPKTF